MRGQKEGIRDLLDFSDFYSFFEKYGVYTGAYIEELTGYIIPNREPQYFLGLYCSLIRRLKNNECAVSTNHWLQNKFP